MTYTGKIVMMYDDGRGPRIAIKAGYEVIMFDVEKARELRCEIGAALNAVGMCLACGSVTPGRDFKTPGRSCQCNNDK